MSEGRRAGRRGARESHEPRLDATKFMAPLATNEAGFIEWDASGGRTEWGMDFNGPDPGNPPAYPNGLGCCGWAAIDHGNVAKSGDASQTGTFGAAKFPGQRPAAYFAYGLSQGEAGTPPAPANEPDQGVDNASWLGFLYKAGVIYGYGEVPIEQMDGYAPRAHGLLIGQNLPDSAESDFQATPPVPWGSPGETPDNQEGHDTWYILGHLNGDGAMITWGGIQPFTKSYRSQFITDAWIIFDADDPAVDHAALQAALAAVHGTDTPPANGAPTPPQPPSPLPPEHQGWWASVEEWIEKHLHRSHESGSTS